MGNSANKRLLAEEQDDPFNRVPDEIIIYQILDKVCDAKSLCTISLVSKKFFSLVYKTQIVSIKFPVVPEDPLQDDNQESNQPTTQSLSWPGKILHFVTALLRFIRGLFLGRQEMQQTSPPVSSASKSFDFHGHVKFLRKLTSMRSLHVEIGSVAFLRDDWVMVKWKSDCSRPASFVLLHGDRFDEILPSLIDDDIYNAPHNVDVTAFEPHISNYLVKDASAWFSFLEGIVPSLPESLQNVVVTDSRNLGRLVLGGDELVGVRTKNATFLLRDTSLRFWNAPYVRMPSWGCVMRRVTLLIFKDTETGKDIDDYSIVAEAFQEDEERVYFEAATELMNKEVKFFVEVPIERIF